MLFDPVDQRASVMKTASFAMGSLNRLIVFVAGIVAATFFTLNSIAELPERVAVHFTMNGDADGWMSRADYRLFLLVLLIVLPSLLVWLMAGLPRLTKGKGQIPNYEYWFAQQRRHETENFLISHACWLGFMTLAIVCGMHISILRANATSPPVGAVDRLIMMLAIYLSGLVWWFVAFLRHFQATHERN
jgi:uncharacterized membrane protein